MHTLLSAHAPVIAPLVDITYSYLFTTPLPPRVLPQELIDITSSYLFPENDNDLKEILQGNQTLYRSSSSYSASPTKEILEGAKEVAALTDFFACEIPQSTKRIVAGTEYDISHPGWGCIDHKKISLIENMVNSTKPFTREPVLSASEKSFLLDSYPLAPEPRVVSKTIEETLFTVTYSGR